MLIWTRCSDGRGTLMSKSSSSRTWAMAWIIRRSFGSSRTGLLQPMTDWRSSYDVQQPDARRRLHPYGDHAAARQPDGAAGADRKAADHGPGMGRDLRCGLY